jgi:hypothetical protein
MAELITREELSEILSRDIAAERFTTLYRWTLGVIGTEYDGDPELAAGRELAVLTNVARSVAVRLASNPSGARDVRVADGGVSFPDGSAFALTAWESDQLAKVSTTATKSREAFSFSPYREVVDPLDAIWS